jgi:hypothetical protein
MLGKAGVFCPNSRERGFFQENDRLPICDISVIGASTKAEADGDLRIAIRLVRFSAKLRSRAMESGPVSLRYRLARGTAKYASLAPVAGSIIALPVISPLSFMSLAVSRMAE